MMSIYNVPDRCDLLIRGGCVIDGTGAKMFAGDVAIPGGVVEAGLVGVQRRLRLPQHPLETLHLGHNRVGDQGPSRFCGALSRIGARVGHRPAQDPQLLRSDLSAFVAEVPESRGTG